MAALADRMIRAARLDVSLYEEVEADRQATGQAMLVVIFVSLATGLSSIPNAGASGLVWGTVAGLLGWLVWAFLTYFFGTRVLPEPQTQADMGQMLRTIGFSSTPGVLRILGLLPGLWALVFLLTSFWMLVAMVIAVRQALDYHSTWRAVGVCILGWIIQGIVLAFLIPSGPSDRGLGVEL